MPITDTVQINAYVCGRMFCRECTSGQEFTALYKTLLRREFKDVRNVVFFLCFVDKFSTNTVLVFTPTFKCSWNSVWTPLCFREVFFWSYDISENCLSQFFWIYFIIKRNIYMALKKAINFNTKRIVLIRKIRKKLRTKHLEQQWHKYRSWNQIIWNQNLNHRDGNTEIMVAVLVLTMRIIESSVLMMAGNRVGEGVVLFHVRVRCFFWLQYYVLTITGCGSCSSFRLRRWWWPLAL
jgi:hypothetical protein